MDDKKKAQVEKIRLLAKANKVEILAHFYQREEVQKAADFVGGSAEVVARAFQSPAEAVMVCGASYMLGEIERRGGLCKPLLVPRLDISCPLSDAVSLDEVKEARLRHPDALIVVDIRASREIKELADLEINPSNAREVLASTNGRPLIALPGPQLVDQSGFGSQVVNRWDKAVCKVHELALPEELAAAKQAWPEALAAVHSLCRPDLLPMADFVGDSSAIRRFCSESSASEFIILSETGLAGYLAESMPEKIFYETEAEIFCPNMKLTNLKSIINCLEDFQERRQSRTLAGGAGSH
ncbi:hypothetical protein C4J81_07805 [Deltaproteobacteria bacterium Smac51]|nr:hypothetical protein C4J81_07805 [Deltaproteobacteria bacterium Smac51]